MLFGDLEEMVKSDNFQKRRKGVVVILDYLRTLFKIFQFIDIPLNASYQKANLSR